MLQFATQNWPVFSLRQVERSSDGCCWMDELASALKTAIGAGTQQYAVELALRDLKMGRKSPKTNLKICSLNGANKKGITVD